MSLEMDSHGYYSLEILEQLAMFYHIPVENLMDEYHIFLYHEPGKIMKQYRKKNHYTQQQLADLMGVWKCTVTNWEKGYTRITKKNYLRFMELKEKDVCQIAKGSL